MIISQMNSTQGAAFGARRPKKVVPPKFSEKPLTYLKGKGTAVLDSASNCTSAIAVGAMIGLASFVGMKKHQYTQAKADIYPRVTLAQYDKARLDAWISGYPIQYMKTFRDSVLGKKDVSPTKIFDMDRKRRESAISAEKSRIADSTKKVLKAKADSLEGVLRQTTHTHDSAVLAEKAKFTARKGLLSNAIDSLKLLTK